jgi:hydroxyacylglutathione hydrolase
MIKKILVILGVIFAVFALLIGAWFIIRQSMLSKMTPAETGLVIANVYAIKDGYVNLYLVRSDSGYIMIDGGNDAEAIEKGLAELKINPEEVITVFLTHTDSEHAGSLKLFPKANVYLSRQEEQMINGKTSRFLFFGNHIGRSDYKMLYDGQILQLAGLTIKGILTPGHTPGTMCYLVNGEYLFTGDVVRLIDGKAVEFQHFINMDTPTGIKSIEKLSLLEGVKYVFTAHHGVSSDFEKAFESFRLCR